jgi:hypothetical protein
VVESEYVSTFAIYKFALVSFFYISEDKFIHPPTVIDVEVVDERNAFLVFISELNNYYHALFSVEERERLGIF